MIWQILMFSWSIAALTFNGFRLWTSIMNVSLKYPLMYIVSIIIKLYYINDEDK